MAVDDWTRVGSVIKAPPKCENILQLSQSQRFQSAVLRKCNASIKKCHKNAKINFTKAQEKIHVYGNAWNNCMKAHNNF